MHLAIRKTADIQPSVSLANLPQLAVDILITSLGLTRVGIIGNGETVVPFFGPGEGSELVTGGLEGELSSPVSRYS
jgi:proteasome assembly chaperone 2